MKVKVITGIMLTLLLISMLTSAFNIQSVKGEPVELYYDDGEADMGIGSGANTTEGLGVRFDHPELGAECKVESAKIYIFFAEYTEEPLRLFVYVYNPSVLTYEKVYENIAGGLTEGWNIIDLTPYDIFVDQDFIIGVNWVLDATPSLGVDEDTQYHSGNFSVGETTNFMHWGYNFMIRAYLTGPYYQLTVTSSPITGITFTINGTPQATPYTGWLLEDSYTLEMPQTRNGHVWFHWLEDGDPNRIKTVTLNTNITLTAVFTPAVVEATIDINPDTLNLKSRGKWITCYIELPEGYNVSDVDRATILLNDTVPVDPFWVHKPLESVIGDYDDDGVLDLMVKLSRAEVISYILGSLESQPINSTEVTLTVAGQQYNGTPFEGSDTIRAITPVDFTKLYPGQEPPYYGYGPTGGPPWTIPIDIDT